MFNCLSARFGGTLLLSARSALTLTDADTGTRSREKAQPKPKRILLVNEQRSFQVMMKAMLINLGINRITYVNSAEEARRRCQKETFDIYLLDYELGGGENGRQLLESLRDQNLIPPRAW